MEVEKKHKAEKAEGRGRGGGGSFLSHLERGRPLTELAFIKLSLCARVDVKCFMNIRCLLVYQVETVNQETGTRSRAQG